MPVQSQKNSLMAQFGAELNGAIKQAVDAPVEYGRIGPPPGIKGGVAQVIEAKFDEYKTGANKGKPYFRMAAVIIEPFSVIVDGREVPAAGAQTSKMYPVCDTKTADGVVTPRAQHIFDIINEMKKVAGEEYITNANIQTGLDLERVAAAIKKAKPYIRFDTSRRPARDRIDPVTKKLIKGVDGVWENWNGSKGLEDYVPPEQNAVRDSTASANGQQAEAEQVEETEQQEPGIDLEALVIAATEQKDKAAQEKLSALATGAGASAEEIENAESWQQVADLITSGGQQQEQGEQPDQEEGEQEEEAATEPEPLKKGDIVSWKAYVAGTGPNKGKTLRAKKGTDHEVVAINKDGTKVNLKDTTTGKVATDPATNKARWVPVSEVESVPY